MEHTKGSVLSAGTTRAVVTVLRTMLDAQPNQHTVRERLRAEYGRAMARFDTDPSIADERSSFEEVFDMLGIDATQDAPVAHDIHHAARPVDSVTENLTDGVDDASMY